MNIFRIYSAYRSLLVIWVMALKDIRSSLTERAFMITSVIIPINFLLLFLLFALTGGQAPTAIVLEDKGPYAQQFLSAMEHSHSFIIQQTTGVDAQNLMKKGQVVAIRVPAAITEFYAEKGNSSPIQIHVKETDLRSKDIDLLRFELVPNLVLLLTTAGIVNAGLATAREWEDSTIKELLLAPISKATLIAGKLLSGWITTLLIASLVLVVGAASGYLRHEDQNSIIPCHQIGKKTNFFTFLW